MPAQPNTEPGLLPLLLREQNAVPCVSGRGEIAPPVVFAICSQILFHIPWEGLSWPPAMGSGLSAAEVPGDSGRQVSLWGQGIVKDPISWGGRWKVHERCQRGKGMPSFTAHPNFPHTLSFPYFFLYLTAKILLTYFSPLLLHRAAYPSETNRRANSNLTNTFWPPSALPSTGS